MFPQWQGSIFVGGLGGKTLDRLAIKNDKVVAEEPLLPELRARSGMSASDPTELYMC